VVSDVGEDALAASGLANMLGLTGNGLGGDVPPIAVGVNGSDRLLVELGQKDVGNRVVDVLRRVLEQVGETHVQAAFAEPDGGVERGEAAEADIEGRDGCAGAKLSVLGLEDGDEGLRGDGGGARLPGRGCGGRRCDDGLRQVVEERGGLLEDMQEPAQRGAGMVRSAQRGP